MHLTNDFALFAHYLLNHMKKIIYTFTLLIFTIASYAQTLLSDNFSYTAGDSLSGSVSSLGGWVTVGTVFTNAIKINNTGLTMTGHIGSGVGNSVSLVSSGQDVYKQFAAVDTSAGFPVLYASALVRVDTAQATGDYCFALLPTSSTSNFTARTFIRRSSASHYRVTITKSTETAVYSTDSFEFGTTYLFVIKYIFNSMGNNNDSMYLYVTSNLPGTEPTIPTARAINATQTDAPNIARFVLRQGTSSNAPRVVVDAIRVATTWANSPLPVQLTSLKATTTSSANTITWTTATELNNRGFELQRSTNDGQYETIAFINGVGNSNEANQYSFNDIEIDPAKSYCYRLKQVDFDGTSEYSKIVCVAARKLNSVHIATQPNPFSNTLNISIVAEMEGAAMVEVLDIIGKVILVKNAAIHAGNNNVMFETDNLKNGIYFVRIKQQNEVITKRVIKN
jgi:hypothetical protein